ncbi:MAG: acetyl-CoA C-acetyltransferase [Caulobacteraceae bacterium]|nr:MAG: acetyl-CoA C-acetyltransferase [Caulobacteraceae bacterium]
MTDPRMPVLIGGGQATWRKAAPPGPRAMVLEAVSRAAADAGLDLAVLAGADTIGLVGFTIDAPGTADRLKPPRMANPPAALAEDLGAKPHTAVYSHMGGNTPQALVNWASERIASGESDLVVLAGAEFLGSLMKTLASGGDTKLFTGGPDTDPVRWGDGRDGQSAQESAHGLSLPANTYPLFENALRAKLGRSIGEHQRKMGDLFSRFSAVAAANPYAWFPTERSADEIANESPENRMVGFPYTKYLNAIIQVDQSAAVILASAAKADELGVSQDKRVYLHGCADVAERWNPLDRVNYWSSPAIGLCAEKAFAMARKAPADMALFDIYSCFPSAVQIACAEIGIETSDRRPLTVTGGLPYFGGPGNNYSMHAIVSMREGLRAKPGAFGLVTANGWFLTKHAMGVYSTEPVQGAWARENPKGYQKQIDALSSPEIVREPSGPATTETYTVIHGRDRLRMGIVIGRDANGRRFVANTPDDDATLLDLESREGVGRPGMVSSADGGMKNLFIPG